MTLAILSLVVLILVVVIGTVKKLDLGLLGIAGAIILSLIGGISSKDMLSGINISLAVQSIGMCLLVVIAKQNGSLAYLSQKIIKVGCGRAIRVMPIILYIFMVTAEFLGMNLNSLLIPLMVALAYEMKLDVMKLLFIALASMLGGGQALFAAPGRFFNSYVSEAGMTINGWNISILATIAYTCLFVVLYFVFGWHKRQPIQIAAQEVKKITFHQACTLLGFVVMAVGVIFFKQSITTMTILIDLVLFLIGACDQQKAVKDIPYGMILMIIGMTMLTGVMKLLGGPELLASAVTSLANAVLVRPLLSIISSAMSVVASASTVVQPTLIPTIPAIAEHFTSLSVQSLVAAIGIGSYATAISPMSSSGLQVMAAYDAVYQPDEKAQIRLFNQLLILAVCNAVIQAILATVGYYGIVLFK